MTANNKILGTTKSDSQRLTTTQPDLERVNSPTTSLDFTPLKSIR